jgi:hypothetical protein
MGQGNHCDNDHTALDELIEAIGVDAYVDDEKLWAFRQAYEADVALPADGFVIGEPVVVIEIGYDGNVRRGLTAKCRRDDGSEHVVAASDVVFHEGSSGARLTAAYRRWLGLDPYPAKAPVPSRGKSRHKATADDLDLSGPVELVVLSVKKRAAPCLLLETNRAITLRASGLWDVVPGEIVMVEPRKHWRFSNHPYLSVEILSTRLDVAALGLVPLRIEDRGVWDPRVEYWGEEGEPIEAWAEPIIARGPRREYEMEQVIPGEDPDDPFSDPITESNDLKNAGFRTEAYEMLMELCKSDLRCLDAHSHLGSFFFDRGPKIAVRHYEVGLRIGELSLGEGFDGVLPWGFIDNRPFLRCMHGYGLCLWRLWRFDEAERVFERMLWLNPSDNQGIRFLIDDVSKKNEWRDRSTEWERG